MKELELTPIKSAVVSTWVSWRGNAKCNAYECLCKGNKAAYVIDIHKDFPGLICKRGAKALLDSGKAKLAQIAEGSFLKKIIAENRLSTVGKYEAYRTAHPELALPIADHVIEAQTAAKGWNFAIKGKDVYLPGEVRR